MKKDSKIYIAGHTGLLGSAILRKLEELNFSNILTIPSKELDLTVQNEVFDYFQQHRPEYVFLAAAKVGGILANSQYPADFLYINLQIQNNILEAARRSGVKKLMMIGSSCIYPKQSPIPVKEEYLMQGPLEPTNEGYALAKIAGIRMCQYYRNQFDLDYISCNPTNLFGPNDCYDLQNSHLLPALIKKIHTAKENETKSIELWGTGKPRREFMYSDDCADALVYLMRNYSGEIPINVGTGKDHTIIDLAKITAKVLKANIDFSFDRSKPDGILRKMLDCQKLKNLGWKSTFSLEDGIRLAYEDFLKNN